MSPEARLFICAISEGHADEVNFQREKEAIVEKVGKAAGCGITHFQIREKALSAALQSELAAAAVEAAVGSGTKVLVNGRFDIALAAGADGVHLPANGLSADVVREHVPNGFLIGVSVHSVDEAILAKKRGADLIVFAPVFASPGKGDGVGLEILHEVCRAAAPSPVLALGGIDERNYRSALDAGASGFAAIRYLNTIIERDEMIAI